MIILASLLLALFIASLSWWVAVSISNRKALEARASAAFTPEHWKSDQGESLRSKSEVSNLVFDDCGRSRFKQSLFLAGVRSRNRFNFYVFVRGCLIGAPFFYIAHEFFLNRLDTSTLIRGAISFLLLFFGSQIFVRNLSVRRQKRIKRCIPEFFDLMIVCFEAGLNFVSALPRIIRESNIKEPLVKELDTLHSEYLAGLPLATACERTAVRCQVPELSRILNAIVQSDKMGSSLGATLRILVMELRDKLKQHMRERAYKIPVKLIFPIALMLVGVLLPLLFGSVFYNLMTALETIR